MFQNLELFQMAHGMAHHAGRLQTLAAQNMANSDTPGYKAQTMTPFADTLTRAETGGAQRATRSKHMNGNAKSDPNGNSVAIEDEILRAVDAKRQHDRALAIYRSSLNIIRTSIGIVSFDTVDNSGKVALGKLSLDKTQLREIHDPSHPLANSQGIYDGSNVDLIIEVADAREAQRSYEANLKMLDQTRQMSSSLMDLLRR